MTTRPQNVIRFLISLSLIAILLTACSSAASTQYAPMEQSKSYGGAPPAVAPAAPAMEGANDSAARAVEAPAAAAGQTTSNSAQAADRIVIKNANLTVVVPDPAATMKKISAMAEEMGGFVVSANMYKQTISNGTEVPRVSITVRVPAARLDEALNLIESESSQEPQNVTLSSQDVTSEYTDLQSRLKNLEAAEKDLVRIMDDANRTEDVMMVYNQLVSIREQIEVIKGQIKYYEQSAALSAISTELIADAAVQPIEIGGWQPQGVAKQAIESLVRTMQGLASFLIWAIIYLLPVLVVLFIIFVLPLWLIVRFWRRRRAARRVQVVEATPPPGA
jgi:hypothetical protein